MKAKGIFISTLIVIDTFLGAYFYGVHSRTIKVIDPGLPAVNQKLPAAAEEKKVGNTPTPAAVKQRAPAEAPAKTKAKPEQKKEKPKKQKSKTKEQHKRKTQ